MQASLDKLSSNMMKAGKENLKNLQKHIENETIYCHEDIEVDSTQTTIDSNWNVKFKKVKTVQQKAELGEYFHTNS